VDVAGICPRRYVFRVYLARRYIFRIYFRRVEIPTRTGFDCLRSLARCSSVKEFARETNVARERRKVKKEGKKHERSHLLRSPSRRSSFREAFRVFIVSLLPAQRFPASDTAGLLILIIERGIIKVALARGRFQLRISVSLGTIGPVGGRETEARRKSARARARERERGNSRADEGPGTEIGDERSSRVLPLACHLRLSVLLILRSLGKANRG